MERRMILYEVWGVHPESDSQWMEGNPFMVREDAEKWMYSLGEIDGGLGYYEIREVKL
jgi:hypothetical protein